MAKNYNVICHGKIHTNFYVFNFEKSVCINLI